MKNQTTQKEYFEQIIALAKANGRDDLADFAQSRIDQLVKKAQSKKPTKVQEANEVAKSTIVAILEDCGKQMTATEILKYTPDFAEFSTPKISALLKQLVDAKVIGKEITKGKSYFFAKDTEDSVQALDGELSV